MKRRLVPAIAGVAACAVALFALPLAVVLQRSYQANSRVVTTVDELSQETINLKH